MGPKSTNDKKSEPKSAKYVVSKAGPKPILEKKSLEQFNEQIINFYHARPPLWDTSDPKYKDNIYKDLLIQKFAQSLDLESKKSVR